MMWEEVSQREEEKKQKAKEKNSVQCGIRNPRKKVSSVRAGLTTTNKVDRPKGQELGKRW